MTWSYSAPWWREREERKSEWMLWCGLIETTKWGKKKQKNKQKKKKNKTKTKQNKNKTKTTTKSHRVSGQHVLVAVGEVGNGRTLGGAQVAGHALVVGEDGGGGANLRTHVADGAHAGARQLVDARAKVLDNGARAALDRQDARHLEDDVLGRRPALNARGGGD